MEALNEFFTRHAFHAHWYVFGALILAGFNLPLSADALILISAFLAAIIIPEHTWHLYLSVLIGCYLSAMCAYWLGRVLGPVLQKFKFFAKLLPPSRVAKIRFFYDKYALLTLMSGRFIPCGVRNCIFMTAGLSKMSFKKFILRDALACSFWCTTLFYGFYLLGQHAALVWETLKTFNLIVFAALGVTGISMIWYKRVKKARPTT
jgi:membrane protein DedA with SNARE-associated domain